MKKLLFMTIIFCWMFDLSQSAKAATVTVDASILQRTLPRYEKLNNYGKPLGSADDALMQALGTRLVRVFMQSDRWCTAEGVYNFPAREGRCDSAVRWGAAPAFQLGSTPAWLADTSFSGGVYSSLDPPRDYAKYERMIQDGLAHYKAKYPEAVYVEAWNEPDGDWAGTVYLPVNVYFEIYKRTANAVNAVNAGLPAGVPKLKVGGPTTASFNPTYMQAFLDLVKSNNVKMDFVSWHEYAHPGNPSYLKTEAQTVDGWLAIRELSAETIVSEWNRVPGGNNLNPSAGDLAKTAAFVAAGNYYWLEGGLDQPWQWTVRHSTNLVKSQLGPIEGSVYPFYNILKMMSIIKTARISAVSNALTSSGLGVGALGSSDSTGIAVLVWNYQNTGSTSHGVTLNVNDLSTIFSGKNIRIQRYLVDSTHSNYAFNNARDKLEMVENVISSPATSLTRTFTLAPNAVCLLVLTPEAGSGDGDTTPLSSSNGNHDK